MKKFLLFLFSISISAQTTYNVSGSAFLDDILPATSDHSGITVKFIDLTNNAKGINFLLHFI